MMCLLRNLLIRRRVAAAAAVDQLFAYIFFAGGWKSAQL
jgi:hypothetical protein